MFQRVEQCREHAAAARADGVAERHGAAVDVHLALVESEFMRHGDRLHGEGLIQFDQVHVASDQPIFVSSLRTASTGVISTSFGARPLVAWPTMRASGVDAQRAGRPGGHHHERGCAVVHWRRVAGRDRAILLERRLQRAQRLRGRVGANRLVAVEQLHAAVASAAIAPEGSRR